MLPRVATSRLVLAPRAMYRFRRSLPSAISVRSWSNTSHPDTSQRITSSITETLERIGNRLNPEESKECLNELNEQLSDPDVWSDPARAADLSSTVSRLTERLQTWEQLHTSYSDITGLLELIELEAEGATSLPNATADKPTDDTDTKYRLQLQSELVTLLERARGFEAELTLGPEMDTACYLEVHAGAGGLDAMDWADMLLRMYRAWCRQRGLAVEEIRESRGDEGLLKSIELRITGPYAYGWLRCEHGVHRLVRLSPYAKNSARHTSFAAVNITPAAQQGGYAEANDVTVEPAELRIDTYRASGPGGQHVNTTDSAVRITHLPSGTVAQCQDGRSQQANKDKAYQRLIQRLRDQKALQLALEERNQYRARDENSFGAQIRSYVLHPYRKVKCTRTGWESGQVNDVLDGGHELTMLMQNWLARPDEQAARVNDS